MTERLYSLAELEKALQVTRITLYNYIKSGKLKAFKVGAKWKVPESSLIEFLVPAEQRGAENDNNN